MSLWDWLLAAFIYEKFFDDDPKEHPNRSTFDDDSFRHTTTKMIFDSGLRLNRNNCYLCNATN